MARRVEYAVHISIPHGQSDSKIGTLLECLRYAGIVSDVEDNENEIKFTLYCPHRLDTEVWSQHQIDRMTTFGYCVERITLR